jgi:hypothetical protein
MTPPTTRRSANRDPDNAISLDNAVEHVATRAELTEYGVAAIEMRLR